jgi:Ser/Thr protein kinase RdoA (MazF antagonist)
MNEDFFNLTPDLILHLVESLGLTPTGHCFALNSLENRVYSVKLENDENIVVKFYRPGRWTREQILEEHRFLFDLNQNEIPVCAPRIFKKESLFEKAGIYCAIWDRTGGRAPEELSEEELQMLGRYLGRLHNVGASNSAKHRIKLTSDKYGREPLNFLIEKGFIPISLQSRYSKLVNEISNIYNDSLGKEPMIRIHGDCHKGNILKGENGFFFLDFDDFLSGPAVQDIWMVLPPQNAEGLAAREALLEGYREFRNFNDSSLRLIEILRAMRYIHYSAWIAKRWEDPSFPNAFPHFGGEEYWEKEIKDLEIQLKFIKGNEILPTENSFIETKEELPLTNKDFFWDM